MTSRFHHIPRYALLSVAIWVGGCASVPTYTPDPTEPERLTELREQAVESKYKPKEEGVGKARLAAVTQAAFSWGVQEGLYWRYSQIQDTLESQAQSLHTIFDFSKFIVGGKMLMPSIVEAERIYEQRGETSARTVKVSYTLEKQARVVPQQPTWEDYLIRVVDEPVKPHLAIFPRTQEELDAWNDQLSEGWEEGVKQADDIFEHDLRLLNRDITGMYRFRKLYSMGVVSMPNVMSSEYQAITFEDGKTLNINDVVYEIERPAGFTGADSWSPFFRANEEGATNE